MRSKIYLSVRSGPSGERAYTALLPLAWAADIVPEAISLMAELQQRVDKEGFDLRDALNWSTRLSPPRSRRCEADGQSFLRNSKQICR
tara:strand:- start:180 stop:443 length:264 start_codon:yes stop_codon:yes gene_type:complete